MKYVAYGSGRWSELKEIKNTNLDPSLTWDGWATLYKKNNAWFEMSNNVFDFSSKSLNKLSWIAIEIHLSS